LARTRLQAGLASLVLLLGGCVTGPRASIGLSGGSGVSAEIARIPAIDHHAHPLRGLGANEKDDEWDPLFAAQEPPASALPVRLRVESGEFGGAWRALWGYSGSDAKEAEAAKQRVVQEQGEKYPAWVLDKLGIETMLANRIVMGKGLAAPRFRWVAWADPLLFPLSNASARRRNAEADAFFAGEEKVLKRYLGDAGLAAPPDTLTDYLQRVVTSTLERQKQAGAVAVKFEMAYLRSLYVAPATMAAAAPVYARFAKGGEPSPDDYKTLQDFLFRYIAHEAGRLGLAVHIHTGAGLGSFYRLAGSEPVLLDATVSDPALRSTTFVLVHGGWPYEKETAYLLGKPNVYADFSAQTFLLSARDLAAVLRTWLGLYPEKVLFGTDAFVLGPGIGWEETAWLSTATARQALGAALGDMTADGSITRARAVELAHMVMHDNAAKLYKLGAP
jgi:predicted TIM-barrel fold metal-dependent hydrolase